ncbi:hypothetical protein MUK42_13313 [Musa troglodytarum]|uniref:Uncharacterized protein n=1 Tax=Musa troglodytarum TaxID=320322 RepID=A0A9E7KA42_9LILI|nr:hypothetical protein MUK42_13313 [Musa troglodytarum]
METLLRPPHGGWARRSHPRSRRAGDREGKGERGSSCGGPSSWAITASFGARRCPLQPQVETLKLGAAAVLDKNRTPAPHGGRGALPSAGGSPSDLLFLAGGGSRSFLLLLLLHLHLLHLSFFLVLV